MHSLILSRYLLLVFFILCSGIFRPTYTADPKKPATKPTKPPVNCKLTVAERIGVGLASPNYIPPDLNCPADKPAMCDNKSVGDRPAEMVCAQDYSQCPPSSGCVNSKYLYKCVTGECVSHVAFCPFNTKTMKSFSIACNSKNGKKFVRCRDGVCRPEGFCKCITYSGCAFGMFQCPWGGCETTINGCAGSGACPVERPFACGGQICVQNPKNCGKLFSEAAWTANSKLNWDGKSMGWDAHPEIVKRGTWHGLGALIADVDREETIRGPNPNLQKDVVVLKAGVKSLWPFEISPFLTEKYEERMETYRNMENGQISKRSDQTEIARMLKIAEQKLWTSVSAQKKKWLVGMVSGENFAAMNRAATLEISSPGTYNLAKVKNVIHRSNRKMINSYFNIIMKDGNLIPDLSYLTSPVLVKTVGRFDDQERFFKDIEMEFIVKKYEPILITKGDSEYTQTALNVKSFQQWNCLAFLETTTNTWKCAVRKLVDVRRENIENWSPGQGRAADAKTKDTEDTTVQWVVRYRVPFPGTWVVQINPQEKLEDKIHGLIYKIPNQDTQNMVIKTFLFVMTVIIIAFTIIKRMNDALHKTRVEMFSSEYKYNLVTGLSLDYSGQHAIQKLEETVRYFSNPLEMINTKDLSIISANNKASSKLSEQVFQKDHELLQQRKEMYFMKQKTNSAKKLLASGETHGLMAPDLDQNFDGQWIGNYCPSKCGNGYKTGLMVGPRRHGTSFYGPAAVVVVE